MAKTPTKTSTTNQKGAAKKAAPKKKSVAASKGTVKKSAATATAKKTTKKTATKKATKKTQAPKTSDRWAEIRAQLEERRDRLVKDAHESLDSSLSNEKEVMAEIGDRATEEIDGNFQARLKGREHRLIAKIDETLARMSRGEYGYCESCGEEIAYKRLLARPVTTMCIDCKTAQEAEERNFRR